MPIGTKWTEVAASVEDREQITPHQDSGLDIDQWRPGVDIGIVTKLDDVRHREVKVGRDELLLVRLLIRMFRLRPPDEQELIPTGR